MDTDWIFAGVRLAAFLSMSGAFVALGFVGVCKWLKWAPVNITINTTTCPPTSPEEGRT